MKLKERMQKSFFLILFIFAANLCSAQFTFEKNYYLDNEQPLNMSPVVLNTIDSGYIFISYCGDTSNGFKNSIISITRLSKQGNILWNKNSDRYNLHSDYGLDNIAQYPDSSLVVLWNDEDSSEYNFRIGFAHVDKNGNALWGRKYSAPPDRQDMYMNSFARTYDNGLIGLGIILDKPLGAVQFQFLIKTDSSGNIEWCKQYYPDTTYSFSVASAASRIALTPDSGFLITFSADDSIASNNDYTCLMKTDANGNIQWAKRYNNIGGIQFTQPQVSNGSIYLAFNYTLYTNIEVMKTDMQGIPIWNFAYSGPDLAYFYDGITDSKGNTVLSGMTGPALFNDVLGYIFKIDSSGNILWSHEYGKKDSSFITNLLFTRDGGILGYSWGPLEYNNTPIQSFINFIKTDANGHNGCELPFSISKTTLPLSWQDAGIKTYNLVLTQKDTILNFHNTPMEVTTLCAIEPFEPLAIIREQIDTICNGYCLCFTDNSLNNPTSWKWKFAGANPDSSLSQNPCNICYSTPGKYQVIFTATNGGGSSTTYDSVTVLAQPILSISGKDTVCSGDSTTLTASPNGLSYLWSTPSTNESIVVAPTTATYYYVQASNGYCSVKDSIYIHVRSFDANACCDTTITPGQTVSLDASGGTRYAWTPATGNCDTCAATKTNPIQTTVYTVTISNDSGCIAWRTITVDVGCGQVFIPTAFSPDEANNSILYVRGPCIASIDFMVFDRWGNKVFESQNPDKGWDGTYKGQPMNMGTYVWFLTATLQDGTSVNKKGNVTLLR